MSLTSSLSGSARRALRAAAHHLDPVVTIGQAGLTAAVLHEIDLALTAHALIKVRVSSDERETRERYLSEVCTSLGCEPVQHLGKLLVLWRNRAEDEADSAETTLPPSRPNRGRRAALPKSEPRPAERTLKARRPRDDYARFNRREENRYEPQREGWVPRGRRGAARSQDFHAESARPPQEQARGYARRRREPEEASRSRWGERRSRSDTWSQQHASPRPPADRSLGDARAYPRARNAAADGFAARPPGPRGKRGGRRPPAAGSPPRGRRRFG